MTLIQDLTGGIVEEGYNWQGSVDAGAPGVSWANIANVNGPPTAAFASATLTAAGLSSVSKPLRLGSIRESIAGSPGVGLQTPGPVLGIGIRLDLLLTQACEITFWLNEWDAKGAGFVRNLGSPIIPSHGAASLGGTPRTYLFGGAGILPRGAQADDDFHSPTSWGISLQAQNVSGLTAGVILFACRVFVVTPRRLDEMR